MSVLLRVLLLAVLAFVIVRALGRLMSGIAQGARDGRERPADRESPVKMTQDPVCGTFVVPGKALSATSGGATVWFCSERCRDEYARRG